MILTKQDEKDLMLDIILQFTGISVSLDEKLEDIDVFDNARFLDFIHQQNPRPCLTLETELSLGLEFKSKNFIGRPKSINTVADLLNNIHGVMYLHNA